MFLDNVIDSLILELVSRLENATVSVDNEALWVQWKQGD